jgi:hypothetical protein
MTPTLLGRWQTRLLLFVVIALPITALFSLWLDLIELERFWDPFVFIAAMTAIGLLLDPLYMQIQRFRWDNDWPFAFQFFFTVLEFLITLGVMSAGLLDFALVEQIDPWTAAGHFTLIFIPSFLALLAGVQVFLIHWRFKGGELGRL